MGFQHDLDPYDSFKGQQFHWQVTKEGKLLMVTRVSAGTRSIQGSGHQCLESPTVDPRRLKEKILFFSEASCAQLWIPL